jgi:hypothetical protein
MRTGMQMSRVQKILLPLSPPASAGRKTLASYRISGPGPNIYSVKLACL